MGTLIFCLNIANYPKFLFFNILKSSLSKFLINLAELSDKNL